jgi:Holliday junction resolvase RusA-like endonuclease
MHDYFNQQAFIDDIVQKLELSPDDIQKIQDKYKTYGDPRYIFAIPITIWARPQPYEPLRIVRRTGQCYVPNKAKLVSKIRELIVKNIGIEGFRTGFFPRYSEVITRSHLYIPTPQAFNREMQYLAECKVLRPIVTPDLDNVEKIVNDSIKGFIIYDDAQITSEITEKYYSNSPRMEVTIFYNTNILFPPHIKTIAERNVTWQKQLKSETPQKTAQHLKKYFSSSGEVT